MSARRRVVLAALAVALVLSTAPSRAAEASKPVALSDLAWLAGSWVTTQGPSRVEEYWSRPSDNVMIGMGRTLRDGRTVFFEYLRLEARDGAIYYVAHPGARSATEFKLTSYDGTEVVFENPKHDFPRRIRYRREADGSVTARTDAGEGESKEAPQEFRYVKQPS